MNGRRFLPWALTGALALTLFSILGSRSSGPSEVPTVPVLQRLRALGELHTARFEYSDVVNHGSYQRPDGILADFPGVDAMARATTGNKALIDVRGSVEAGVDLKKMSAVNTPTGLRIVLPNPQVYAPQVDAKLFSVKRGLFWRDDAVALDAVTEAKNRLSAAALRQGILNSARTEAKNRVRSLAEAFGAKIADIRFGDA